MFRIVFKYPGASQVVNRYADMKITAFFVSTSLIFQPLGLRYLNEYPQYRGENEIERASTTGERGSGRKEGAIYFHHEEPPKGDTNPNEGKNGDPTN